MLTYQTAGESHGPQLTAMLSGLPAGMPLDLEAINYQLARRQKGYGRGGRMKIEQDQAEFTSGLRHGLTLGGPVTIVIKNRDWENWTKIMAPFGSLADDLTDKQKRLAHDTKTPRPGHADLVGGLKHNQHDLRNILERASARETAARVAVGAVARQLLEHFSVTMASHVVRIGTAALDASYDRSDLGRLIELAENSEVRCIDKSTEEDMIALIKKAMAEKDSLGGIVELIVAGLPAGLGGFVQSTDRLEGRLAQANMSIQSVKGVEFGLGFAAAASRGSEAHDEIFYNPRGDPKRKKFFRKTNRAGGLEGGMTNGENLIFRVACKPISTLNRPLASVDVDSKQPAEAMVERTDSCVAPALAVVCEAVTSIVLAEAFLSKFGSDNFEETQRNYQSWLDWEY